MEESENDPMRSVRTRRRWATRGAECHVDRALDRADAVLEN
jgi:hypothetical protein